MAEFKVYPSILAADPGCLRDECVRAEKAGADGLHIDIMDGQFVKNISLGFNVIQAIKSWVSIPLNVHLMIIRPDWYVKRCVEMGADMVLFHIETECDIAQTLKDITSAGAHAGLTINPDTPVERVEPYLPLMDEALCMSVYPGFGGQDFMPVALPKISWLREKKPTLDISIDGGINKITAIEAARYGANVVGVGTALFHAENMAADIQDIKTKASEVYNTISSGK